MKKKAPPKSPAKIKKPVRELSDTWYLLVAFVEGAAVIAVELLGAKMLSPYYGNSLPVWTAVIGVTIGFLTLGYFLGGLLASKKNLLRLLSYALSLASLLIIIMPVWSRQLFLMVQNMSLYTGATLVAALLLGPPLLCLGCTSPLIIQQLTTKVQFAGKSAGKVYAISTLGGIAFNFLLGFLVIPQFGISKPLIVLSVALLALALYLFIEKKQIPVIALVVIVFITSFSKNSKGDENGYFTILHESEGMLGQLKVLESMTPEMNYPSRFLLINGIANTHMVSIEELNTGYSGWMYVHKVSMIASLKRGCENALLLGLGGGSIATELKRLNMKVDAVDFDGRMLDIAKKYFYLNDPTLTFIADDARHYLRTIKKKYELVVFDVLNNDAQPSYVFTTESLTELKNILTDNGMVIIEFQEYEKKEGYSVYKSLCNTLMDLGYQTYLNYGDDLMIVASMKDIDISKYTMDSLSPCCHAQDWAQEFLKQPFKKCEKPFDQGVILTDDKPMIDVLNAETIKNWRINAINSFGNNMLNSDQEIFK